MTIFSVADVLTGVIEALLMLMLCTTFCAKRENLPLWIYFASVILVSTVINISNMIFNFGMLNVVVMILAFFAQRQDNNESNNISFTVFNTNHYRSNHIICDYYDF